MLEDDWIDYSEGIGINNANDSQEYRIRHSWYFLKINFKFNYVYIIVAMIYYRNLWALMTLELLL